MAVSDGLLWKRYWNMAVSDGLWWAGYWNMSRRLNIWFRSCNWCWYIACGHSHTRKDILFDKFYGLWDKMCYSLYTWLAFICVLYLYILYDMTYILIIWIRRHVCKWHFLETRDCFYSVDNNRDLLETSVSYYPVAHSRHLDVQISGIGIPTFISHRQNTNQSVTGHQRTTPITLK